jgi:hypothetical protein
MVPMIDSNALRDLITVCLLLDAEICARRNVSSGAGSRQFFYLETQDGLGRPTANIIPFQSTPRPTPGLRPRGGVG